MADLYLPRLKVKVAQLVGSVTPAENSVTPAMMEHGTRGDILTYNGSGGPPTRLAKGTTTYVLTAGADDVSWAAPAAGSAALTELIKATTGDALTATECTGRIISNYGQTDDCVYVLPAAAAGYNFLVVLTTTVAKYLIVRPASGEYMYLDGAIGAATKGAKLVACTIGNSASFYSFKSGASSYAWGCIPLTGAWIMET
jgi:hypothetical protein